MTDIRDRVRTIERSDRTCVANKAIAYRPEPGDEAKLAGHLVRIAMSADVSEIEIDDIEDVDGLAEVADAMAAEIVSGEPLTNTNHVDSGVQIRATSKEIIISIPGSANELDAQDIYLKAEKAMADYSADDFSI